jgi:1-deoxy-D-xylulose-5-phosphate reductoisomerase
MGAKISVDSATLMNKGLEVIEAAALFSMPAEQIGVVIHPESIVHGIVEYEDGAQIACLFSPDMRQPISYALGYLRSGGSNRVDQNGVPRLRLAEVGTLTFLPVDAARYPALGLCYNALRAGGTMTTVLNAANEVAVERFLGGQLGFLEIVTTVERVLERHEQGGFVKNPTLDEIIEADRWARTAGKEWVAA